MNAVVEKPATVQDTGYRCGICRQSYIDHEDGKVHRDFKAEKIADGCCICDRCKKPIMENDPKLGRGKRSWHDACSTKFKAEHEAKIIAKARVDEEWGGPVSYGDKYFGSIDDLEDHLLCDNTPDEDWPKFAFATKPITVSIDGEDMLYNVMENHELDTDFRDSLCGDEPLLKAIEVFNEANKDSGFYTEDMSVVVPVTPKEELSS